MDSRKIIFLGTVTALIILLSGCVVGSEKGSDKDPSTSSGIAQGEVLFNKFCAECHGISATGTNRGPSFIDRIYEPNHHADEAFYLAPKNGVRAHHWNFGNMPQIKGVTEEDADLIRQFVRALQKDAGIY